jgi:hypothetical protein
MKLSFNFLVLLAGNLGRVTKLGYYDYLPPSTDVDLLKESDKLLVDFPLPNTSLLLGTTFSVITLPTNQPALKYAIGNLEGECLIEGVPRYMGIELEIYTTEKITLITPIPPENQVNFSLGDFAFIKDLVINTNNMTFIEQGV